MSFLHWSLFTLLREFHFNTYPFTVPAIRGMDTLDLDSEVTFFVGENDLKVYFA